MHHPFPIMCMCTYSWMQVVSMDPTTHQAVILYPSTAEEEVINLMEGVGKKELAWPPPAEAPVPPPAFKPGKASMAKVSGIEVATIRKGCGRWDSGGLFRLRETNRQQLALLKSAQCKY